MGSVGNRSETMWAVAPPTMAFWVCLLFPSAADDEDDNVWFVSHIMFITTQRNTPLRMSL